MAVFQKKCRYAKNQTTSGSDNVASAIKKQAKGLKSLLSLLYDYAMKMQCQLQELSSGAGQCPLGASHPVWVRGGMVDLSPETCPLAMCSLHSLMGLLLLNESRL